MGTGFTRGGVVKIATITDGTSNSIAFGEHAHGLLSSTDKENSFNKWNWWVSGNYGDTAFTVFYPINVQKRTQNWDDGVASGGYTEGGAFLNAATSFHPGGANFAFCDGSVRFLKDTISTWVLDNTGTPLGATMNQTTKVWSVTKGRNSGPASTRPWARSTAARSSAPTHTDRSGRHKENYEDLVGVVGRRVGGG